MIMDIEEWREYCLSLPMVTEDMAFGEGFVLFRVWEKIFGGIVKRLCLERTSYLCKKIVCDEEEPIHRVGRMSATGRND